ncbi:MAG TPA: YeeE/YedE family protein [Acetobacteraceae bacterium]
MSVSLSLPRAPAADVPVLAVAAGGLTGVALKLANEGAWSSVGLLIVAAALGWVFLARSFGYTGAFRAWLTRRDGAGLAAGLLVALVAALIIIPVSALVGGYSGYQAPLGLPLVFGAMLFGVGMQLGNGCGSGTLYAAGGGSRRTCVVLPFFCVGGLLGTLALPAAVSLPALPQVSFGDLFGPWIGLAVTLALGLALTLLIVGRGPRPDGDLLRAAALIGALAAAVFLLSGQPWGITTGLTLWGAKAAAAAGLDVAHATYWTWDGPRQMLTGSILHQDSSLTDIGMILGATAASAWRGGFRRQNWPETRGLVAAAIGGLLMGFGARLSFGCNIGALVGGIASGSLHGFIWFFAVLPGCWLGIRLRPKFGLAA